MPERSPGAGRPRHLVEGSVAPPWWRSVDPRRVLVAGLVSFAALPVLVVDNLATNRSSAEAVETAATSTTASTATTVRVTTNSSTATTLAPTTVPPTTAALTAAPSTTAAPTTAPPTTAARRVAPTTVPPTSAPPTTAPPAPPPPPAGSVEATIRSWFPEVGDAAVEVARCESGLDPAARSAAGYRGLFQLSPSHASSFAAVTGRDFEDAWDEAEPNTQYARYLYDRQGWAPWGACAP